MLPLSSFAAFKAVCVAPIADLVGEQKHASLTSLPIAHKRFDGPARVHQLLYNEIVEVHEMNGREARIKVPQLFYETSASSSPQQFYWTSARNLMPLRDVAKKGIPLHVFPQPLTCNKDRFERALHNTVSLTQPFFDPQTKTTYSAGTRFVIKSARRNQVVVSFFDRRTNSLRTCALPKNICLIHQQENNQNRLRAFVDVVKTWAHLNPGFVPYVWGGCSVGSLCKKEQFVQENGIFTRGELPSNKPQPGLDCAGLIARAAHLAGIPYFYKNSLTIAKHLAPLNKKEMVSEGDIIWIPGHVMVVSSLKDNLLVEARHYSHGYGKVHEIPLGDQFKNINSYEQLTAHFFNKKPLQRLDKAGKVVQVLPDFKILKLASVWRN
jgi:hypothetical protein